MHVLDIAENSVAAAATLVEIRIRENFKEDILTIDVTDNGRGMAREAAMRATDPFFTSRTTREVGLGLPLLKAAAERCGGSMAVQSAPGKGTKVTARFGLDHVDRAPLGDMADTIAVLITGNADIDFLYEHEVDGKSYRLATKEMREILDPVRLDDPRVHSFIREDVDKGLKAIGAATFPKMMEALK